MSAVCVITADVRGGMRARAEKEGEKRRQLKGMCKQENFITRRPVMYCERVSVLQMLSSICPSCTGPAPLALSHYSVSTTRRRVISHTCFNRQDRKMQEIHPTPCELTETLAPHRWPTVLVGAQPHFVHRGNKNLRSVVELLMSPHTRSLPGQSAPCSHIFSSTQQEWTPD